MAAIDGPIVSLDTVSRFHRGDTRMKNASRLRFIAQPGLRMRVTAGGFSSADGCGDWHGAPFDDAVNAEIIAICRA